MSKNNLPTKQEIRNNLDLSNTISLKSKVEKFISNLPVNADKETLTNYIKNGRALKKAYDNSRKSIHQINKHFTTKSTELKNAIDKANTQYQNIFKLEKAANDNFMFFVNEAIEVDNVDLVWQKYLDKHEKYTTYTFEEFELAVLKRKQELRKEEKEVSVIDNIETVQVESVEKVEYRTNIIVDYDKLDVKTFVTGLLKFGYEKQLTELARKAFCKEENKIDGVSYIKEPYKRVI